MNVERLSITDGCIHGKSFVCLVYGQLPMHGRQRRRACSSQRVSLDPLCDGSQRIASTRISRRQDNALPEPIISKAHPDKERARKLCATRPDLYKDENHKPEMAVALSEFEGLCGFRSFQEIRESSSSISTVVREMPCHSNGLIPYFSQLLLLLCYAAASSRSTPLK